MLTMALISFCLSTPIDLDLKRNNELAFSWDPSMAEKANPRVFFFPKGSSECHPYYRRGQINGISLAQVSLNFRGGRLLLYTLYVGVLFRAEWCIR